MLEGVPLSERTSTEVLRDLGLAFTPLSSVRSGVPFSHGWDNSNERFPVLLDPILSEAPRGLYVVVGADRAFEGASRAPNCDGLLVVDRHFRISQFACVNAMLIGAPRSNEQYCALRQSSENSLWLEQFQGQNLNPAELNELHTWWLHSGFAQIQTLPFLEDLDNAPYSSSPERFSSLSALIRQGCFSAAVVDLQDSQRMVEVVRSARKSSPGIAVLDVSNAWQAPFISPAQLQNTIAVLRGLMVPGAILIRTLRKAEAPVNAMQAEWEDDFVYVAEEIA